MIYAYNYDVGCKRSNNEDYYYIPNQDSKLKNIAIVADGMGGHNAGEIASKMAISEIINYLSEQNQIDANNITMAIKIANSKILKKSNEKDKYNGMGTTITIAYFHNNNVLIGHVGDSRAYVVSNNEIKQITKDHSYVQMLLDNGEITFEQAQTHPLKNVITKAVGTTRNIKPDIIEYQLKKDDVVLLCTDGLINHISDGEIFKLYNENLQEYVNKLVKLAKTRGGDDNITVIAACFNQFILSNRYKIINKIGTGGMSNVYCAMDLYENNKLVSIKLLKKEYLTNAKILNLFRQEAKIVTKLKHKNLVNGINYVEDTNTAYIVSKYIEGQDLKTFIEKYGAIEEEVAINISMQIARGLRYAHNNGIIHKDVKPQNIILDKHLNAYVTDFGLAGDNNNDIDEDLVLGSVYYLAPEQAKGKVTNARSDIYSLGIVMYEMVSGKLPFDGEDTHKILSQHIYDLPNAPNEINPHISMAISQVIMKAISKDPESRYVNFNSFLADMEKAKKHPIGGFVSNKKISISSNENTFAWKRVMVSFVVLMAIFGGVFTTSYLIVKLTDQYSTTMPDLSYTTLVNASTRLDEMGVRFDIEYVENNNYDNGIVVEQSIEAGNIIDNNSIVIISVVKNTSSNNLSNLVNLYKTDATNELKNLGFKNIKIVYMDAEYEYDYVVDIEPKKPLNTDTVITLYLSNNVSDGVIPNLTGKSIYQAIRLLEAKGLKLGIVYEEENTSTGIYSQFPSVGEISTNEVDVWIGRNKNKNVEFNNSIKLEIADDETKVMICYMEDGIEYYINEFILSAGSHELNINFLASNKSLKTVNIYYNNSIHKVINNFGAKN